MKTAERKLITPTDILLILIITLLAVFFIISFSGTSGKTAVITVDGAEVRRINLDSADNETLTLDTNPVVTLHISEGTIRFTNSQCPSKTCQHRGELKNPGDVAACVPAGVVVSITDSSNTKNDVDAVVG
jgi:hypothetical protein